MAFASCLLSMTSRILIPEPFAHVDYVLVAFEFARRHYRDRLGLDCHVLPNPVDWERVQVEDLEVLASAVLRDHPTAAPQPVDGVRGRVERREPR